MKRVFSSNAELTHIWAQQTQFEGRGNNLYFRDSMLFSYGDHYLAAQIHTAKGKKFALINAVPYSPSTGRHLRLARSAVNGLMPYFYSPDVGSPIKALAHLEEVAKGALASALKKQKITSQADIRYEFASIHETYKRLNGLKKLLGKKEKWPAKKELDAVQVHLEKRFERYEELNSPEMLHKKAVAAQRKKERDWASRIEKNIENIVAFRSGKIATIQYLDHAILRIKGDVVETSLGAKVPLAQAKLLFAAIKAGKDVTGFGIGSYNVNNVQDVPRQELKNDKLVHIGCHRILLSEAEAVLGGYYEAFNP